jgi:hypothetical protein
MWHSAHESSHHGGNDCFEPHRQHSGGWGHGHGHDHHHGGGWGGHGGFDPGWGGGRDCDPGWGDFNDCHDGGRGLISFDHNSFLVCH